MARARSAELLKKGWAMVTVDRGGMHLFRVFLPHARSVRLLGDFTAWGERAVDLQPEGEGWWSVEVEVPPGDHDFAYLVDGAQWMADFAAHGVRQNGYGGWVSCLAAGNGWGHRRVRAA